MIWPLIDFAVARRVYCQILILDRNATVGGLGLVFTRPRAVRSYATYTDTIYRYHISICYRDCRSLAPVPALEPAIH